MSSRERLVPLALRQVDSLRCFIKKNHVLGFSQEKDPLHGVIGPHCHIGGDGPRSMGKSRSLWLSLAFRIFFFPIKNALSENNPHHFLSTVEVLIVQGTCDAGDYSKGHGF